MADGTMTSPDAQGVNGPVITGDLPAAAIGGSVVGPASMAMGTAGGAAAGGLTGWCIGMTGGYVLGLVTGMFLALALAKSRS